MLFSRRDFLGASALLRVTSAGYAPAAGGDSKKVQLPHSSARGLGLILRPTRVFKTRDRSHENTESWVFSLIAQTDVPAKVMPESLRVELLKGGEVLRSISFPKSGTAANAAVIRSQTRADLARVATVFQRNTIDPGETYFGAVVVEPLRRSACKVVVEEAAGYGKPEVSRPGPCKLRVSATIEDESHTFDFNEIYPG